MEEKKKTLIQALIKAIGEVEQPKKTSKNGEYDFPYAPLEEILRVVKPVLSKNGLAIVQVPEFKYVSQQNGWMNGSVCVTMKLIHESGEEIEFPPIEVLANGITPQSLMSALTYARRYQLNAIFALAGDVDDDGNIASGVQPQETKPVDQLGQSQQQEVQQEEKKVEKITNEQAAELQALASILAKETGSKIETVVMSLGVKDFKDVPIKEFDKRKQQLITFIEKAKAKNGTHQPSQQGVQEQQKNKGNGNSRMLTVAGLQPQQTPEGEIVQVFVEGANAPLIAHPHLVKNLGVGDTFKAAITNNGGVYLLTKVSEVLKAI